MADMAQDEQKKITTKYSNLEQIEARRKKILEQKSLLEKEKKELDVAEKKVARKQDGDRVAIIGRFVLKHLPDVYEKMLKMKEFDEYLNRDVDRKLFGFQPLKSDTPVSTPKAKTNDRLYLTMTFEQSGVAKKTAEEILGADWKEIFKWDAGVKRWYLCGDGIAKAEAFGDFKPHDFVPAAPVSPAVSIPEGETEKKI